MNSKEILSAICFCLLAACSKTPDDPKWPTPGSPVEQQSSTEKECKNFIASLPSGVMHDFIEVPEDPTDLRSPRLKIFFYGRLIPGKTPILFANGGPGEDSHSDFRVMNDPTSAVSEWANAPLIFFDQRGNGCSSTYPQGNDDATLGRLRFYGSSGIVADAEAIRKHLIGDKPWKMMGQSYGGWIAHRYAALAPKSLIADFSQANVISASPLERVTNRIASQNRVLQEYFKLYPGDQAILATLHTTLVPGKCYPNATASPRACGLQAIYPFTQRLPFVSRWPWIHNWLTSLVHSGKINDASMLDFTKKLIFNAQADPKNLKSWPGVVIDFYDRNVPPFDRPTCEVIYSQLRARNEIPENYLLHECMTSMQFAPSSAIPDRNARLARFSAKYGNDHLEMQTLKTALQNNSQMKFYLYSGQLDTMVPVESFTAEVSFLGNLINYTNFLTSGHDGYYSEHKVAQDVLQ